MRWDIDEKLKGREMEAASRDCQGKRTVADCKPARTLASSAGPIGRAAEGPLVAPPRRPSRRPRSLTAGAGAAEDREAKEKARANAEVNRVASMLEEMEGERLIVAGEIGK
jgi:hypothetical protein